MEPAQIFRLLLHQKKKYFLIQTYFSSVQIFEFVIFSRHAIDVADEHLFVGWTLPMF